MSVRFLGKKFSHSSASTKSFAERGIDRNDMGYPNDLAVGMRIFGRIDAAVPEHSKPGEIRPLFVTGLWKEDGYLKKIEVMQFTTQMTHISPGDFLIDTPEMMTAFDSKKPGRLRTAHSIILDNKKANFPHGKKVANVSRIAPNLWFDILARRAYSLMYDPGVSVKSEGALDLSLVRTGFTFRNIPDCSIRSDAGFIPDHPISHMSRTRPKEVSQNLINIIPPMVSVYINSNRGKENLQFPPSDDWPDFGFSMYPNWKQPSQKPSP